ncbi:sensor histidine kinase [Streptococcus dentiloxodontae]
MAKVYVADDEKNIRELIERALTNLLSNALRYAKTLIKVSTKRVGHQLQITIANDGAAISPEDRNHIFERFYKGAGGNFGIGLAMTKDIVERHGGKIEVVSTAAETQFIIYLPMDE